ncbi:MAG: hypothetical protein M0Z94_02320 [Dehalococcoidales bacterium]|nr:hypothetical protein [Dehalococcoidales bacterium]
MTVVTDVALLKDLETARATYVAKDSILRRDGQRLTLIEYCRLAMEAEEARRCCQQIEDSLAREAHGHLTQAVSVA